MRTSVFRSARWVFRQIPPWILRWRPFGIYEIRLPVLPSASLSVEQNVSNQQASLPQKLDIRVDWLNVAESDRLLLLSPPSLLAELSPQCRAAVAWQGDRAVGVTWVASDSFRERELGLLLQLDGSDAWLFASHVLADHRQQGVYSRLLEFVFRELSNDGKRRILLGTTRGNEPSRIAHERMGARAVGSIFAARLFSWLTFASRSGAARRLSRALVVGRERSCRFRFDYE